VPGRRPYNRLVLVLVEQLEGCVVQVKDRCNSGLPRTCASGPSCSRGTLRLLAGEPPRSGKSRLQFSELCIPRLAACVGLVDWLVLRLNFARQTIRGRHPTYAAFV